MPQTAYSTCRQTINEAQVRLTCYPISVEEIDEGEEGISPDRLRRRPNSKSKSGPG